MDIPMAVHHVLVLTSLVGALLLLEVGATLFVVSCFVMELGSALYNIELLYPRRFTALYAVGITFTTIFSLAFVLPRLLLLASKSLPLYLCAFGCCLLVVFCFARQKECYDRCVRTFGSNSNKSSKTQKKG
eukprot:c13773_g1_i3.p1 GENE.c13773_g1_i3~~c13773_g1_i3.p1  ORF type:complete len:131 (+),score=27.07 c13773_g1_i3:373-765(+)